MAENTQSQSLSSKWRERLNALRNFRPLGKLVWEAAPGIVVAELAIRAITGLLPVAMLWVTKYIIDDIVNHIKPHNTALPSYFWWLVVLEFSLACLGTILSRATDFCDTVLADKYARYISIKIMDHGSRLDLTAYEDPVFYDKMERARVQGTDRIVMIQASGRLFQQFITTVSLAAAIIKFSPLLLVGLIVCVVPAFIGETHFAFLGYSLNFQQTPAKREMEYLRILGGSKESAKELKLFGLGPFFVQRYTKISDTLHDQNVSLAKSKLLIGAFLTLLGTTGYYGTYGYVIYETVAGLLTIGTLTLLAGAISGASSNIQQLFSTFSSIADQALFMADLLEFFEMKPKVVSKPNGLRVPRPIAKGFEFRDVCFSYPGNPRLVLDHISFWLRPSERIALVGENGQGKTTIVKLLTRLYDVTSGQILLDGIDIRDYDLEDLWREIGVIFQDFMRYEMTAARNIGLGRIEHCDDEFRIRAAARKSFAEQIIRRLPKGFQQTLGVRFEGGVELSGGEWQRIALARAYLRDAQVLILDEPTAALDARSEHDLFQRFADLTTEKMSVLISHRFSTVRMADRILVLDAGKIAEQGGHDELVKYGGRYAEMFEMQAANYR
ncbi:MAG TPA: ABC transporter ATP-binding protein [Candidatus Dormibacteraeota bacterium]|nr:ABC transporter ATP-binding protein [Candidatus Dormibacteraeota bacterium]